MCARFTLSAPPQALLELFSLQSLLQLDPRFNIAPTQNVLAVRTGPGGNAEFVRFRWGLIPSWASDASIGQKLLNARSETVAEKPSFRDSFRKRRCLIVADGFYEWKTENKKKYPFHIHLIDRKPFAFAGIWDRWEAPDGNMLETCSVLTTDANALLRPLHDRMPVILKKEEHSRWLDARIVHAKELQDLFAPYPEGALAMSPVSPRVNRPQVDDPACIEPIVEASSQNRSGVLWQE